jgi:hypothetical protein
MVTDEDASQAEASPVRQVAHQSCLGGIFVEILVSEPGAGAISE